MIRNFVFSPTKGKRMRILSTFISIVLLTTCVSAGDWTQWRGPNGNGIAEGAAPPVKWSSSQNVVWKTPVPGRGHSSPTIVGNRIYMATSDERQQIQSVVAFERNSGKQVWQTTVHRGQFPRRIHNKNTHATSTVACDGERLFIVFFNQQSIQMTALDLNGKELWQETIGAFNPKAYQYGYAASPTIYKDLVLISADVDRPGGVIAGLNRKSGKVQWKIRRAAKLSWSSPIVANISGRDQLLISGCDKVTSFNPSNGRELWSVAATTMATCGTMVWEGDLVFASGGYPKAETVCIRADGSGRIVWKNRQKCYEQSMLAHNGYVYAVDDRGIAVCWKGSDGSEMWKSRLSGPVSASPILAGGNIYASNERGVMFVIKANPRKFELVAQNQLGNSSFASPTICDGRMYLRVGAGGRGNYQETLYCIGQGGKRISQLDSSRGRK